MLNSVNIKNELIKIREREIGEKEVMSWVHDIFEKLDTQREKIRLKLSSSTNDGDVNNFDLDKIDHQAVFHISQIKKICVNYRLRFLDTSLFKGEYPEEAISEINRLEATHNTSLNGFKIIAPSKLFRLKETDDPLLFVPIGNGYYYLIYQWGNDLHSLRKFKFWPIKNVGNLSIFVFTFSFMLTVLTHSLFFRESTNLVYGLMLFMFYLKGLIAWILFVGISSGKNFSEYCWQSPYNKIS
ncbi:hypothetical protein [Tenacibaculum sp. C7A-26P2]|uniref:hypothetical protein n=1 Tax=Tenacibaculum sp. C7A-26P2 TaxID=3447504 RepID=UPI003F873155